MRLLLLPLLASLGSLMAVEAPPAGADAPPGGDRFRERMMQRMIADNPELKDVDPKTTEGQEKIRTVMEAQMRKRMGERQAENHTKLKTAFAMSAEEFTAIEPLLSRVENLRQQKTIVDPPTSMFRGGLGGGPGGGPGGGEGNRRSPFNPLAMLGGKELEAPVKEVQDATKALKTLVEDPQANAAELTSTVARVRKAREAFQAVLTKAQEDLRSVLTPRQEAILIEQGTLE